MIAAPTSAVAANRRRLALGTVQFGLAYGVANTQGKVPFDVAEQMVRFAAESGLDTIDTAIGYGDSEATLGRIGVGGFKVVSKLMPLPDAVADVEGWVLRETEASLVRLKIDRLHGLLLHRSSDLHGPNGRAIYAAMQRLKSDGRAKRIGISIYSPAEIDACGGKFDFDLVQAPVNLVDRRLESSGWLERLKSQGCEIHARSAFLQGLLLLPRAEIPAKFGPWDGIWKMWHGWLERHGADAVGACLRYPLSIPQIDRVVVGANDRRQLQQIFAAADRRIERSPPDIGCSDEKLIDPSNWPRL